MMGTETVARDEAKRIYFARCDEVSRLAPQFEEEEVIDLLERAILAEREACANEAESCADEKNAHPEYNFGCWTAADLIRMRSHVNTVSKISEEV